MHVTASDIATGDFIGGLFGQFQNLLVLAPYLLIAVAALLVQDGLTSFRERTSLKSLALKNNAAVGLRRLGLHVGLMIGFSGILIGDSSGRLAVDLVNTTLYAGLLIAMMQVAIWVNDALILPNIPNSAAVRDGNIAVASAEVGSMVATGFIAQAAIGGANGGILAVLAFFAIGQLALVLMTKVFAVVHQDAKLIKEVESGNRAAGIVMGAKLWAYGLVIATAASGEFTGWTQDLSAFFVVATLGLAFMLASSWLVDLVMIRWHTLSEIVKEKNDASALIFAGGQIGLAWAIATLII